MAAFPSVDLTDLDLAPLVRGARSASRSVSKAVSSPGDTTRRAAKGAAYTAIGLGVMTWQRLQTRRRELSEALGGA